MKYKITNNSVLPLQNYTSHSLFQTENFGPLKRNGCLAD
jgi:hypothetical protein